MWGFSVVKNGLNKAWRRLLRDRRRLERDAANVRSDWLQGFEAQQQAGWPAMRERMRKAAQQAQDGRNRPIG